MNIRLWHGASASEPVYRSNATGIWGKESKRYRFDTYGDYPPNVQKWNPSYFGAAGVSGQTDDVSVLLEAIMETNRSGKSALICDTLFEECQKLCAVPA